jgi:hypothetical protein
LEARFIVMRDANFLGAVPYESTRKLRVRADQVQPKKVEREEPLALLYGG